MFTVLDTHPILDHGYVDLLDVQAACVQEYDPPCSCYDAAIAASARVSTGGRVRRPDHELIDYLVRNRHSSPLEMVTTVWRIKLPIFVARQMVRHRTASINEESARYTTPSMDCYVPSLKRMQGQSVNKQGSGETLETGKAQRAQALLSELQGRSKEVYAELIELGLTRELARLACGVGTYTTWIWRTDLRNLLHFFGLRCDSPAQLEIGLYANAMKDMIRPFVPVTLGSWERHV